MFSLYDSPFLKKFRFTGQFLQNICSGLKAFVTFMKFQVLVCHAKWAFSEVHKLGEYLSQTDRVILFGL